MAEESEPGTDSPKPRHIEVTKTVEIKASPELSILVPKNVAAAGSGGYVLEEVKKQEPSAYVPPVVGSTVTFFAVEAEKEKLKIKRVKVKLGFPPELSIEWERG